MVNSLELFVSCFLLQLEVYQEDIVVKAHYIFIPYFKPAGAEPEGKNFLSCTAKLYKLSINHHKREHYKRESSKGSCKLHQPTSLVYFITSLA